MLNSLPVRLIWHSFNWLTRIAIVAAVSTALLCAIIIIVLRYWLLPNIEQFHDKIATSISAAMGNPVNIGKIEGNWGGMHPHLNFTDVRVLDSQGQPALLLPHIDASVSWLSLPTAQLRLSSLEIDRPELLIRRDAQGNIYVGSIAFKTNNTNNDFSNWLLHQSRMVVRNAILVWQDDQRSAPPLVLNQVNLRIENLFSHHQFSLRAVPPAALSAPLDVRGDFHGHHFDEPDQWRGQLFAQIDRTDLLAWRPWLKLPPELSRGRGALRVWLGLEKGKVTQLTADMALRDVTTRLLATLPEMNVDYLRGRAAWKTLADSWEVSTQKLSMRLHNGLKLEPTDFYFHMNPESPSHPAGGELRANVLQLESLVSLANYFPLDAKMHEQMNTYAPRGKASNLDVQWQIASEKLLGYKIKGQFENLAMQQVGNLPGFSGLTMSVDGSQTSGSLNINTRNLNLNAPGYMREPLLFNTLTGQASWLHEKKELSIKVDNVAVANDDLAGNVYGSYQTRADTRGVIDLTVNLTRGDLRRAARYTPLIALRQKENDWLNSALLSGHTEDFHLRLKGNLSDFPLDEKHDASFEISAHAAGASMEFAHDWPIIENLSGGFFIHNNRMEVIAPSASILGAQIHDLSVILPDMMHIDAPLQIKARADATNNSFLQFIQKSPVRGYIDGFTDGVTASGNGQLELSAQIPLLLNKPVKVAGLLRMQNSDIDLGAGAPTLRNTKGELSFTESGMKANNVTTEILGGPARLNVQTTQGGPVRASLQGRINLDALRKTQTNPLLSRLHGETAWDVNISMVKKIANLTLNTNLQGISSSLPAPFTKSANEIWPLHIERKNIAAGQFMISAQLAKLLSARLVSNEIKGVSAIRQGVINFGEQNDNKFDSKSGPSTELRTGIWLTGRLPALSLQGWDNLSSGSGQSLPIAGANLHIDKLTGFGLILADLQISAGKRGDSIAAQISGAPLNGEVIWQPQSDNGVGKLTAHLRNLYLASDEPATPSPAVKPTVKSAVTQPQQLPAMDISIEDLLFKNKNIGHFELTGSPDGQDWRLRRLHIINPDGTVTGDGLWRSTQTQVNLLVDVFNAGKILARSGYPDTVRNGKGKLVANLSWDGQPDEFNYATLDGTLKLDTGKGQFLKMDPGFGKLLGILSLQALPKRIALDFTDVFSAGFEFDNINGNATIKHGLMQTDDLHIDGSSAKVTMKGSVNLNDETQNLHIVVLPTFASSITTLGAFAAGPVVGLGAFIVSKVLGNPLDKLTSFEYNVSGTWANPNVVKVGEKIIKPQTAPTDTPKK